MNYSGLVHSFKKSGLIESYTSTFIFQVKKGQAAKFSDVESTASSQSELVLMAQEQYLTTILERTETNTLETLERIRRAEVKFKISGKVEKILKGSLDLMPSPSPSVKTQIMGGKVCLRYKGKTLLGTVNKLLKTSKLSRP